MALDRDIILVFGKTGMGKTQWTRQYLRTLKRVIILDPLDEYDGHYCDDPGILFDWSERYKVFRLKTNRLDRFDDICLSCAVIGNLTFIIEESQRIIPVRESLPDAFEDLIYRGRHSRTSLCIVAQRASTVNIAARSQWTRLITFNQTEKLDVSWVQQTTGFPDLAINSLTQFQYYDISPHGYTERLLDPNVLSRKGVNRK